MLFLFLILSVLGFFFLRKNFCVDFCDAVFFNADDGEFNALVFDYGVFILFGDSSEDIHDKTAEGIVTNGGRVLGITAKGANLKEARANAYAATEWVSFENKYMRHDIGKAIDEA